MELSLIGLTVVVLGVNFLSVIFEQQEINLAIYGIGYSLPILSLSYFMKIRSGMERHECNYPMTIEDASSKTSEQYQLMDKKRY
jgi:hypothetical protein